MTPLDRLRVIYELDDTRFTRGIERMRTASDRFARDALGIGRRTEGAFGGIGRSALAAAAGVASLGVALNKVRSSTDAFKTIENQLRSIGQSSDEATDKLLSSAIRSRSSIEELATGVARIQKATGDGYDITLRRVETLNKLLAVGGATAQEVSSVMIQLSQAFTSGELMGEELRALREAAPVELLDAIAAAAGATRGELKKLGEDGKLTNEVVTRALDNLAATADRRFGDTTQTIGQALTNINNALTVFVGRVDEGTGASGVLVDALTNLSIWLTNNADEAVELGQSLGAMFDVVSGRVGEFVTQLDSMADALREAFDAEPMEGFGDAVQRAVEFIAELNGVIEGAAAVAKDAFLTIADNIADGIQAAINGVIAGVETMVNTLLAGVRRVAAAIDTITAGAASLNNRLPEGVANFLGLRTEGTNLAGQIGEVELERVKTNPRNSSGKPLAQVYQEARDQGAARVVDALDQANLQYGGNLARRQIASQTPIQLGLPPVVVETPEPPAPPVPPGGNGASGGKKGRSAGRGRAGKTERPFFENIEQDLVNLERQISLVGKSNEEVATARARWEMLDEAKKRGIPINAELTAQIDAQAEQFGRLTGELERAQMAQQQFEQAVDGIANAMAGALLAGESLREGLANVLRGIAADIMSSGIRNALMSQFGGGGGNVFAGMMQSFFGGGDRLSGALRLAGARASGGPVLANRAYMVGERGPEVIVPGRNGTVIPNSQLDGGQAVVLVQLSPELVGEILEQAQGQAVQLVQDSATVQQKALPARLQRAQARPRER